MMDESRYLSLADEVFRKIDDAFADIDPDIAECERAGDVVTITFRTGTRCVVNTQRPTRQIWVAAKARAWHFDFDAEQSVWRDAKDASRELFQTVSEVAVGEGVDGVAFG